MNQQEFYSHGKLMICGEYAVLHGATAFAVPAKKGQFLRVEEREKSKRPLLEWKAFDKNGHIWFEAGFSLPDLITEYSTDAMAAIQLLRFLINAGTLNPGFLKGEHNISVETALEFDLDEGLGSSSTLTNNIAQWAGINPFSLHFNAFKGSGFDVAVAAEGKALLYTMNGSDPKIEIVDWNKPFREKLFLVHLNKKQNSRAQIAAQKFTMTQAQIAQISRISKLISVNDDYFEFCLLLELAENEMSQILGLPTVKQDLFGDFNGSIKSLGAWGGDYILACGENCESYFKNKGYKRIYPFNDLIK